MLAPQAEQVAAYTFNTVLRQINEFLGEIRYTEGLAMNQLYTRTYRRNAKVKLL